MPLASWSPFYTHFGPSGSNLGGFPIRFDNLLELLTEFRKTLSLWLHFYFRGYRSGPGKWRDTQSEVQDSPKHRVSGPFVKSGCIILLALHCVHQSGRVFIWCRHDWSNHWLHDSAQSLALLPYPEIGVTQNLNPFITLLVFLVTSVYPEPSC